MSRPDLGSRLRPWRGAGMLLDMHFPTPEADGTTDGEIDVRVATPYDVKAICAMRVEILGWAPRPQYVAEALGDGHAVVAFRDGVLVGVRYQRALAPDTIGDGLILVHPDLRGQGLGRRLVETFEATLADHWGMSIVVNTDLLPSKTPKPPATGFWERCGYTLIGSTGGSRAFIKKLGAKRAEEDKSAGDDKSA